MTSSWRTWTRSRSRGQQTPTTCTRYLLGGRQVSPAGDVVELASRRTRTELVGSISSWKWHCTSVSSVNLANGWRLHSVVFAYVFWLSFSSALLYLLKLFNFSCAAFHCCKHYIWVTTYWVLLQDRDRFPTHSWKVVEFKKGVFQAWKVKMTVPVVMEKSRNSTNRSWIFLTEG